MFISLRKQNVIEWLGILSNDDNSPLVLINAPCLPRALQGVRANEMPVSRSCDRSGPIRGPD